MVAHRPFCAPTRHGFLALALAVGLSSVGWAQFGKAAAPPASAKVKIPSQLESLVQAIQTAIEPDSWEQVGGAGSISALDDWGILIVSQTDDVHEKIGDLIAVLRKVGKAPGEKSAAVEKTKTAPKKSLVVENDANAKARTKIVEALQGQTTLEFEEAPLAEVVQFLQSKHKIPVYLDIKALEEVGLSKDTTVTVSLKGISLRSALRLVLSEMGLTHTVKDEVLKVTTPEVAESELITRVYSLRDLLKDRAKK